MSAVRVLAPAKINPWLEVLGRRPDGYHELETFLLALDLCDVLEARAVEQPGVRVVLDGPHASADVPRDESNLAVAAAARVLAAAIDVGACSPSRGLELRLTKNIPSRAGLGGGSSNAAAGVLAAERVLEFELPRDRVERDLAALGSDCVFFRVAAATGFARCTGRGERVEPMAAIPPHWRFVVITPTVEAPTAAVYGALTHGLRSATPARTFAADVFERALPDARSHLFNRLEDACLALLPELSLWRALFDSLGASHFRLCGSGSSFFGLFADETDARTRLAAIVAAARERGLRSRGAWMVGPARSGVRVVPSS